MSVHSVTDAGRRRLALAILAMSIALVLPAVGSARERSAPILRLPTDLAATPAPGRPSLDPETVYLPPSLDPAEPVPMLVALHGYSGSGAGIAARLRACADQYGWVLVAPTMVYRDYFDPDQLRTDAVENLPRVHALIDAVRGGVSGLTIQPRLLLYGFSRGAQMAHRFSMVYPGEVAAVATLAAGSYTLPEQADRAQRPMRFPFGIGDLDKVGVSAFDPDAFSGIPFWIGVGANDTNPADTSRAWDGYEGPTRLDRARAFSTSLAANGNAAELHVFGGAGHEETGDMRADACAFLASHADIPAP